MSTVSKAVANKVNLLNVLPTEVRLRKLSAHAKSLQFEGNG
jgi:hypothetical protein